VIVFCPIDHAAFERSDHYLAFHLEILCFGEHIYPGYFMILCRETVKVGVPRAAQALAPRAGQPQGLESEVYLRSTSQGARPEDARKDGYIHGRSNRITKYPGYVFRLRPISGKMQQMRGTLGRQSGCEYLAEVFVSDNIVAIGQTRSMPSL
jgi:hypothetical protein